jgi:hypothetical protein
LGCQPGTMGGYSPSPQPQRCPALSATALATEQASRHMLCKPTACGQGPSPHDQHCPTHSATAAAAAAGEASRHMLVLSARNYGWLQPISTPATLPSTLCSSNSNMADKQAHACVVSQKLWVVTAHHHTSNIAQHTLQQQQQGRQAGTCLCCWPGYMVVTAHRHTSNVAQHTLQQCRPASTCL